MRSLLILLGNYSLRCYPWAPDSRKEVTPLFEIGATLGSSLAPLLHLSIPFSRFRIYWCFSGATNTPIACFIMGIELFGSEAAVYFSWFA